MANASAIEWTDATWNPVTGCDRVSPGCAHCYALDQAARLKGMGQARYQRDGDPRTSGPGFGLTLHPDKLNEPDRWRKPRMVFVNSMSDLFHEQVPHTFIYDAFRAMARNPRHTFQVLTKRPERMREFVRVWETTRGVLPNVWLGTSIENRRFVGRADVLRDTPAAVRFISAEPLLGPLIPAGPFHADSGPPCPLCGRSTDGWWERRRPLCLSCAPPLDLGDIDWLIVGGESGAEHRPVRAGWVRDLRDYAQQNGTAFFFKQWGGRTPKAGGRELDGRTWDEMPTPVAA